MALSAANILLQITGDGSDGEKTLADISRDLALFARQEAEAAAYVDTTEAKVELDELKAKLEKFKAEDVSAEVNVKIAKAEADLAKLQAELSKIDHEDVNVDVDVKRGNVERIAALAGEVAGLGKDLESTDEKSNVFARALSGIFSFGVDNAGLAVKGLAVFLVTGLVAALAAVAASLAQALAGAGALAIAFGALIPAGVALAIGAIAKFKEDSETAGTAAYALKGNLTDVWNAFKGATSGGANAVFQGLSEALRDIYPMVSKLRPAFTALGEAVGAAFGELGKTFSSPFFQHFFSFIIESLAELTPLFSRSFGALARILANIAQASMPYLISGFQQIAQWLESIGDSTSNISDLRGDVGGLVEQLKAWLHFAGALGEVFLGFIEAAAPQGKAFVEWLTEGAEAFADWEKSAAGRKAIHEFFSAVLPLAKETITAVAKIAGVFLQIEQLVAPVLTTLVEDFNKLLGVISNVVSWVQTHFPQIASLILGWISPIALVAKAFPAIAEAATAAWDFVKQKASDVWNYVTGLVSDQITFDLGFASDVASRARDVWNNVKSTITDRIQFLLAFASDVLARARNIWEDVKGKITNRIQFLLGLPDDVAGRARDIWSNVKGVVTDVINFLFSLPGDIVGRARDLWSSVKGVIADAISFVFSVPHAVVSLAQAIWNEVKGVMSAGIDLVINLIPDVSSLPGKVAGLLGFANGVKDLLNDTFALVGERGPELAFLPQGTDIYTAGETRNILSALGRGQAAPVAAVAGGGGGGTVNHNEYNLSVSTPGTGNPDPDIFLAQLSQKLRTRGIG